jgi:hypothetical protein
MELFKEYWIPWLASNGIALVLLWLAIKKQKIARWLFVLLFGWACWINFKTAHLHPEEYLNYAAFTPFGPYRDFIIGWFSERITLIVSAIAMGQGIIALGMLLKGVYLQIACIGAIIFFLSIAPLGIGSGFPAPIIAAITVYIVLKKDNHEYLWIFRHKKIS